MEEAGLSDKGISDSVFDKQQVLRSKDRNDHEEHNGQKSGFKTVPEEEILCTCPYLYECRKCKILFCMVRREVSKDEIIKM